MITTTVVGIVGSGMPETYEMLRLIRFVRKEVQKYTRNVSFPAEFNDFLEAMIAALGKCTLL